MNISHGSASIDYNLSKVTGLEVQRAKSQSRLGFAISRFYNAQPETAKFDTYPSSIIEIIIGKNNFHNFNYLKKRY
jgi:hypothetical protein